MPRHAALEAPPPQLDVHSPSAEPGQHGQDTSAQETGRGRIPTHSRELFRETLLEVSATRYKHRAADFLLSLTVHILAVVLLVMVPLMYTETIDLHAFTQTLLVAPPPPPPPPPPPAVATIARAAKVPRRIFTAGGKLIAPTAIPKEVRILKEEALPPDIGLGIGVEGGVPGGVPGGQLGGVIGGIVSNVPRTQVPLPPPPQRREPVRVGGRVLAPRLIHGPQPDYPMLARQARVEGDVVLEAVIDTAGNVVELQVLSGHPLLVSAALSAVSKWKYQPTILNDEPVPVRLEVVVKFRLQ
ncbi:MAG: TonB family protein [Firmicutes bacterium]|nr:TonB family protein [Bacillota bacterium]